MVTFQFIPYSEMEKLTSFKRINKILNIVKENKIVLMEGRLRKEEEADLIEITMEEISRKFKGIELSVIYPDQNKKDWAQVVKSTVTNMILGDRQGLTIVGPASVVKRIEQNPGKIELFTKEVGSNGLLSRKKKGR